MTSVRAEKEGDAAAIAAVNVEAFGGDAEARLVEALRRSEAFVPELSLVAIQEREVVGHILFTRASIESGERTVEALALAPMAVKPSFQRRGVGSELVRRGLETARELGYGVVLVIGHPDYYPRFGFVPARPRGITTRFEAPDDAFLVRELVPGALRGVSGQVRYAAPFEEL